MTAQPHSSTRSDARFSVVYHLQGSADEAWATAREICFEQTVETPPDLLSLFFEEATAATLAGQIEQLDALRTGGFAARISYPIEATAYELPQLLTVVCGNSLLKPGIWVERLELPEALLSAFAGPRFGRAGLRQLVGVPEGPLLLAALKPMGLTAEGLAAQAYQLARGGMTIVKDDHGLSNQSYAPFRERVAHCVAAVQRANAETGSQCLYAPCVSAPADKILERALLARELGAGALLIAPGVTGFDAMRQLADDDRLALPILMHPTLLGSFFNHPAAGIAPALIFAQLARLAGADLTIFPNYGGRYAITREACQEIAAATHVPFGQLRPTMPAPGGSVSAERIADMAAVYGDDVVYLLGRGLYQPTPNLSENLRLCRELIAVAHGRKNA